jgi:hypothetical protein
MTAVNTGFKGIDIRQTANQLVFRSSLKDPSGNDLTSGTTTLKLYEVQSDGTFKSYDFSSNTFKTTALTTETEAMTHQTGNNGGTNTGVWTYSLATLSGFTVGAIYIAKTTNTGGAPVSQEREFQFGSAEGDLVTVAISGATYLETDVEGWKGSAAPANTGDAYAYVVANLGALGAAATAIWTTALTESYAALHAVPTAAQALFAILCRVKDFAVSGTTITNKKMDGSTTAEVDTIDSATTPTTRSRTT